MTPKNVSPDNLHASTAQLLKATALAAVAAGVILLVAVIPAEYGRDPTGIGKALGLTAISVPKNQPVLATTPEVGVGVGALPTSVSPAVTVIQQPGPFQSGEMSLTLQANQGAEIKAQMRAGEAIVFSWATDGGAVNFDMHGEKPNAGDEFTSYWQDRAKNSGHGSFTAPFDGSHGWYWKNKGSEPVTVTVKISGYFEKLYRPG